MTVSSIVVDECREFWAGVAQKYGWYKEPFYVQVWVDENGVAIDSVSHIGLTEDIIIIVYSP